VPLTIGDDDSVRRGLQCRTLKAEPLLPPLALGTGPQGDDPKCQVVCQLQQQTQFLPIERIRFHRVDVQRPERPAFG
jgi:hypothetical protein